MNRTMWKRYERGRSKYLEIRALELLSTAMGSAQPFHSLTFPAADGDGQDELDGLLMLDHYLFLVECKAGGFTPPARRGAPKRMIHDLEKLVADAHSQALKARRYISTADSPTFVAEDGTAVTIDKSRFDRIFLVTVTLEPLDPFTPVLHRVADLGIFEEEDLPWAIYLLDLRVISELIEYPAQLIHYLDRRLRLHEAKDVEADDELDWFGHYMHEGLSLEDLRAWPGDKIQLLTYTTDMDDYFLHQAGERATPASKPAQPIPKKLRQVIEEVEREKGEGYVDVVCRLLDMGSDARKKFVKSLDKIRQRSRQDGGDHNFSMFFSGVKFGLTVFSGLNTPPDELVQRLQNYCIAKKYQTKMDMWLGLGSHLSCPGLVHAWVMSAEPWRFDAQMEELVGKFFPGGT